jgi:hypothetical protein
MIDLISDTDPGCLSRIRLLSIPDPNGLYPWYALKKNVFQAWVNVILI